MTILDKLIDFLERKAPTILVVGDVMLDQFVTGDVSRISPEGPFPVLDWLSHSALLGGAGNVVQNLRSLGASVDLVSVIGADSVGEQIRALLKEAGVGTKGLYVDEQRVTTVKTRYGSHGHQILRVDKESRQYLDGSWTNWISSHVTEKHYDAIVISDYGKGAITTPGVPELLVSLAQKSKLPTFVDTKRRDVGVFAGATVMKPNRSELSAVAPAADSDSSLAGQLIKYRQVSKCENVVATLGEGGIAVLSKSEMSHSPSTARRVFDVTGAGDTVLSCLVLSYLAGMPWEESARLANFAASIVVSRYGTSSVNLEELKYIEISK